MIRGCCIAIDQNNGRTCGWGLAIYLDPEHGLADEVQETLLRSGVGMGST